VARAVIAKGGTPSIIKAGLEDGIAYVSGILKGINMVIAQSVNFSTAIFNPCANGSGITIFRSCITGRNTNRDWWTEGRGGICRIAWTGGTAQRKNFSSNFDMDSVLSKLGF